MSPGQQSRLLLLLFLRCAWSVCPYTTTVTGSSFRVPPTPGPYANNVDCVFRIPPIAGFQISISISYNTEASRDFIYIAPESSCNPPSPSCFAVQLSGVGSTVYAADAAGDALLVSFITDSAVTGTGFQLTNILKTRCPTPPRPGFGFTTTVGFLGPADCMIYIAPAPGARPKFTLTSNTFRPGDVAYVGSALACPNMPGGSCATQRFIGNVVEFRATNQEVGAVVMIRFVVSGATTSSLTILNLVASVCPYTLPLTTPFTSTRIPATGVYANNVDCVWTLSPSQPLAKTTLFITYDLQRFYDYLYVAYNNTCPLPSSACSLQSLTGTGSLTFTPSASGAVFAVRLLSDPAIVAAGFSIVAADGSVPITLSNTSDDSVSAAGPLEFLQAAQQQAASSAVAVGVSIPLVIVLVVSAFFLRRFRHLHKNGKWNRGALGLLFSFRKLSKRSHPPVTTVPPEVMMAEMQAQTSYPPPVAYAQPFGNFPNLPTQGYPPDPNPSAPQMQQPRPAPLSAFGSVAASQRIILPPPSAPPFSPPDVPWGAGATKGEGAFA